MLPSGLAELELLHANSEQSTSLYHTHYRKQKACWCLEMRLGYEQALTRFTLTISTLASTCQASPTHAARARGMLQMCCGRTSCPQDQISPRTSGPRTICPPGHIHVPRTRCPPSGPDVPPPTYLRWWEEMDFQRLTATMAVLLRTSTFISQHKCMSNEKCVLCQRRYHTRLLAGQRNEPASRRCSEG